VGVGVGVEMSCVWVKWIGWLLDWYNISIFTYSVLKCVAVCSSALQCVAVRVGGLVVGLVQHIYLYKYMYVYAYVVIYINTLTHTHKVCCSTLQPSCNAPQLQNTTSTCNTLQHTATHCTLQDAHGHTLKLQHAHCSCITQHQSTNTLQHAATHCNTLIVPVLLSINLQTHSHSYSHTRMQTLINIPRTLLCD